MTSWHRRVLGFAVPVILANLTQPILAAVDTGIAGHLLSNAALGGVAIGGLVLSFLFWSFGFLRMTTTGLISQAAGAGDAMAAWLVLRRSLLLAALIGLVVLAIGPFLLPPAIAMMGGSADVMRDALAYAGARLWSAPATLAGYVVLGTLLGKQRAKTALALQAAINLVNIAAALLLVYAFGLGVAGLGAATAIADATGALLGLALLWRRAPRSATWREIADGASLKALLLVNRDMFIRTICLLCAFTWFTHEGAAQGDEVLAANAVLLNFQTFMAYGLDGFANAAEALTGAALGARDLASYRQAVRVSTLWAGLTALGFSLAFWLLGQDIVALLTNSAALRRTTETYLGWAIAAPLVSVWGFQLDGIFIGAMRSRDLRNAMIFCLACFLGLAQLLVHLAGNTGLWLAFMGFMALRGLSLACLLPRIARGIGA